MAENQMDGGLDEGTATNANGSASGSQGVQQPSFDAAKLQEVLDAVGTLSKRVDGLQSVKDKQASELTGLKGKIAEYEQLKERLGSSENALEQMELRETLDKMSRTLESLQGSVSTQPPGKGASGAVDAAQVVREYGLDATDPQVALLANAKYENVEQVELAIARHIKAKNKAPSPTAAQQPVDVGSSPASGDYDNLSDDEIGAKIESLSRVDPRGSAKERARLVEELERREKSK